jgi:hypothetical protein
VLVVHAWSYARELRDERLTLTLDKREDFGATCGRQLQGKVVSSVAPHIDLDMARHRCEVAHEIDVANSVAGSDDETERYIDLVDPSGRVPREDDPYEGLAIRGP